MLDMEKVSAPSRRGVLHPDDLYLNEHLKLYHKLHLSFVTRVQGLEKVLRLCSIVLLGDKQKIRLRVGRTKRVLNDKMWFRLFNLVWQGCERHKNKCIISINNPFPH